MQIKLVGNYFMLKGNLSELSHLEGGISCSISESPDPDSSYGKKDQRLYTLLHKALELMCENRGHKWQSRFKGIRSCDTCHKVEVLNEA